MKHRFETCSLCSYEVKTKRVSLNYKYKGIPYLINNVPVGLCSQCGEMYLVSHLSRLIERYLEIDTRPGAVVTNPVINLPREIAGF